MANIYRKGACAGYLVHRCCFHSSGNVNTKQQIRNAVKKLFGTTKKKRYYLESPTMPSPNSFSKGSFEGKPTGNARRATVLNKLFMRHITDQMATGQYASEILGRGIEINRVKMNADYKILNVYWLAKGTADDEEVEIILKKTSGFLRHELSQLRIMGNVPVIQFVKDKHYAHIVELDNRLKMADFGEDYEQTDPSENLKTEFELCAPLQEDIKSRIAKLEAENSKENSYDLHLPAMPQDVLGLNHYDIMDRVKKLMKKSEALHRQSSTGSVNESWATFKVNQTVNNDPVDLGSERSQREAFKEFLHKRQILKYKARIAKNYTPDAECINEELRERHQKLLNQFTVWEIEDDDYLEDEFENPEKHH